MSQSPLKVTFQNSSGTELVGWLDYPVTEPRAYALFAHCFTCSKDFLAASTISTALRDHAIATLRLDFTGLGESSGDFSDTNFSTNIEDLFVSAEFLRSKYQAPRILIGHSLGGTAMLAAAARIPERAAVITIGAPYDPDHVRELLGYAESTIESQGVAWVSIAGRKFQLKRQFLEDISSQNMRAHLQSLDIPLLILHAPSDEIVGIENASLIFGAARYPKSFIALDGMDHFIKRKSDGQYVAHVAAAWVDRYLD